MRFVREDSSLRSLNRFDAGLSVTESLCHRALRLIEGEQVTTLDEVILENAFAVFGGVSHVKLRSFKEKRTF